MSKTLLLADDSVTIQKVVGISFANEDVRIVTVDNGDDAVSRARELRPDVILADVVMPGRNGYEVCEAIKADESLRHIPVLLLTGTFEAFDDARAQRAGADGHITKPFEAQALVDQVNALLARAPAPAPARPAAAPPPAAPVAAAPDLENTASPSPGQGADDAFDFFEEEEAAPPAAPAVPAPAPAAEEPATTAFELDAGESAFDFAPMLDDAGSGARSHEAPTVVDPQPPPAQPAADATTFLAPEPGEGRDLGGPDDALDAAFDDGLSALDDESAPDLEPALADDLDAAPEARTTVVDFDAMHATGSRAADELAFGANEARDLTPTGGFDPLAELEPEGPDRETFLDPEAGADFDVSSSDLGDPLAAGPLGSPAPVAAPDADAADATLMASDLDLAPASSQAHAQWEPAADPFAPTQPRPVPAELPDAAPPLDEDEDLPSVPGFDLGEEPDVGALETGPLGAPEPPALSPEPPARPGSDARPRSDGPDLSPVSRERLHDSLEKIAWEAFADLPDRIVREVVARVEAIAWEVIPQMAEALVAEEIRRMKGETE